MKLAIGLALTLTLTASAGMAQSADASVQSAAVPITMEVFQVLELPVSVLNPVLVKTKGGYLVKCSLANSSEFRQLGLRYSVALLNSSDGVNRRVISRNEGFVLAPYQTRNVTFKTPLKLNLSGSERLVLMLEQLISTDYVWNVINPKEALTAYTAGDYSITPRVLRVRNQVDAPPRPRVIY